MSFHVKRLLLRHAPQPLAKWLEEIRLASKVSHFEIIKGFRRNSLGLLWQIPQHLVFIFVIGWLSSAIFGGGASDRIQHGSLGYLGFFFLSVPTLGSCQLLLKFPILDKSSIRPTTKVMVGFISHFVNFALAFVVLSGVATGFMFLLDFDRLANSVKVVMLATPFVYSISALTALAHLRFRDTEEILSSLGRPWFLTLPIFWHQELLEPNSVAHKLLISFNPFGIVIVELRNALMGMPLDGAHLTILLVFGLILFPFVAVMYGRSEQTIRSLVLLR